MPFGFPKRRGSSESIAPLLTTRGSSGPTPVLMRTVTIGGELTCPTIIDDRRGVEKSHKVERYARYTIGAVSYTRDGFDWHTGRSPAEHGMNGIAVAVEWTRAVNRITVMHSTNFPHITLTPSTSWGSMKFALSKKSKEKFEKIERVYVLQGGHKVVAKLDSYGRPTIELWEVLQ